MAVIGIGGEFGSGKDAAADVLVDRFGFTRLKFADALRVECWNVILHKDIPSCVPDDVRTIILSTENPDMVYAKPTTPEMRRLLQWWGEWRRTQDEDYWVEKLKAKRADLGNPDTVITDPRHDNEGVKYIQNESRGRVWKVVRPGRKVYGNPILDNHATEQWVRSFTGWDAIIINDGTLDQLHQKVWDLAKCEHEIAQAKAAMTRSASASEFALQVQWHSDWIFERNILQGHSR